MQQVDPDFLKFGLRAGIAIVVSFLLAQLLHLEHGLWLPISTAVVIRFSLGESVKRVWDRFLGTVFGVVIAIILYFIIRHALPSALPLLLLLVFSLGYMIRINYLWCMAIAVPLIFIGEATFVPHVVGNAFFETRIINIGYGVIIGFLASALIFPRSSKDAIHAICIDTCKAIGRYIDEIAQLKPNIKDLQSREKKLDSAIQDLSKHIQDRRYEPGQLFRIQPKQLDIDKQMIELSSVLKQFRIFYERRTVKPIPEVLHFMIEKLHLISARISNIEHDDINQWPERTAFLEAIKAKQIEIREENTFEKYGIERVIRASAVLSALEAMVKAMP